MFSKSIVKMDNRDFKVLANAIDKGNQEFSKIIMSFLEKYQSLDEKDISLLCSRSECRELFHSDYSILKKIDPAKDLKIQVKDRSGHNRYYSDTYIFLGAPYVMTSQLYGYSSNPTHRDNRTPFFEWVLNKVRPPRVVKVKVKVKKK